MKTIFYYHYYNTYFFFKELSSFLKFYRFFFPFFLYLIIHINFAQYAADLLVFHKLSAKKCEATIQFLKSLDSNALAEVAKNWQVTFVKPATLELESIQIFHGDLWLILGTIFFTISYICIEAIVRFNVTKSRKIEESKESKIIEFLWTILPILIILFIILPSIALTSILDNTTPIKSSKLPSISVNLTGNQWYWQYELHLSDFLDHLDINPEILKKHEKILSEPIKIDSYMIPTTDLKNGDLRGLAATQKLLLPAGVEVHIFGNSKDVIHSWTVNGFGVKLDTIPGRVNSASFETLTPGMYHGQCSEICGSGHASMPVDIEVVDIPTFSNWVEVLSNFRGKYSGVQGVIKYIKGDYGQHSFLTENFPEIAGHPKDQTFHGKWEAKQYELQAQRIQRFRLMNDFWEWLGYKVNRDESHLLFNPRRTIYNFGEEGYINNGPGDRIKVDEIVREEWEYWISQYTYSRIWKLPVSSNMDSSVTEIRNHCIPTTNKPSRAQTLYFPWTWKQVQDVESSYISNEYSVTLPSAMSFVSCKNQWYGPNFNSYDNDDGNIWYFNWYLDSMWMEGTEYQLLYEFPQKWGFNNEEVMPVLPAAYIDGSDNTRSLLDFKQELGYRFITKKIRNTWENPEHVTVLMQGIDGKIKDTGVPIDEIWCAKFKFVSVPPLKNLWTRYTPQ